MEKTLVALAERKEGMAFAAWVWGRCEVAEIEADLPMYSPKHVTELAGVSRQLLYYWEGVDDFPVPEPERSFLYKKDGDRIYTPKQVVAILSWYYKRKVCTSAKEESRVLGTARG